VAGEYDGTYAAQFSLVKGGQLGGYYFGDFQGADSGGAIVGEYKGTDDYTQDACQENGAFFANIDSKGHQDLAGLWNLSVQAELVNCDDPAQEGPFMALAQPFANLGVTQLPTPFGGLLIMFDELGQPLPIVDLEGNAANLMGLVNGNAAMLMLMTQAPMLTHYNATLMGAAQEVEGIKIVAGIVQGTASPDLVYMHRTCEISGIFTAQIVPVVMPVE